MFVYFIQWYSLLPLWCNLALSWRWTHAHDMNLPLQLVARWKHSIVLHWVFNLIHMAQTQQCDWKFCSWIISEFENKYLWLWVSQNLYLVLAVPKNIHVLWTTLNWVPKNFRISKKDSSSLCRIPNPDDSSSCGRNSWILQDFEWFSWNFGQNLQNFWETAGISVRLTKHPGFLPLGLGGGGNP